MSFRRFGFVLTAAFTLLTHSEIHAAIITQWTFETSIPTTSGPLTPEVGTGSAISNTGGTFSNPAGNGTAESWSSTAWDVGDYFQFQTSTTGFEDVIVSFDQTGSNTGPRDFQLSYSTDGTTFTNFGSVYSLIVSNWNGTTVFPGHSFSFDLSSIPALDNVPNAYFRLSVASTTSINGTTVASGGTGRIDTFTVNGTAAVPEPGTIALSALAGLGFLGYSLRRKQS